MKYIKTFEMTRQEENDKVDDYQKYTSKWVIIKNLDNGKLAIAKFRKIQKDHHVYLYIPSEKNKGLPMGIGGYCCIHVSHFDVLNSCDNIEDCDEIFNNEKIKEESNKYNL